MRGPGRRAAVVVAAVVCLALLGACVPRPPGDFFAAPSPLRYRRAGTVIWAEPTTNQPIVARLGVLTVINDFAGILGGNLIANIYVGIPTSLYWRTVWEQIAAGGFMLRYIPHDFIHGLVKPFVFGGIISTLGCHFGLKTSGGTEGVGVATTRTVVTASILILVVDYFITQVLLAFLGS